MTHILGSLQEPQLGRRSVGDGLLGRERLRRDDEERRLRVQLLQGLGHVGAVDVRDEMNIGTHLVGLQSLSGHKRTLKFRNLWLSKLHRQLSLLQIKLWGLKMNA